MTDREQVAELVAQERARRALSPWKRGNPQFVCKCKLCERGREFDKRVKRLSPESRQFFEGLYDALNHAEFELDWLKLREEQSKDAYAEATPLLAEAHDLGFAKAKREGIEEAAKVVERMGDRLGGIETPMMEGDNLAILLCSFFDNPDQPQDEETYWTEDAIKGAEEVLDAIRAHYLAAIRVMIKEEPK